MVRQQNEVIKFLVATGADISTVDFDGDSPLHLACALILSSGHSNLETVRLLVALKADPNRLTFAKGKRNCLQQCCLNGNLELIKLLVESANANVTLTDEEGRRYSIRYWNQNRVQRSSQSAPRITCCESFLRE